MITTITFDDRDLKAATENLRKKFPQAVRRAVTRAATAGQVAMARAMVDDTGLPVGAIKKAMNVTVDGDGLSATIEAKGKRIPLIDFKARGPEPSRGKGRGVSYSNPGGGRGRNEHAFIATMPSGHRGVFQRAGNAMATRRRDGRGWSGLPIKELFGPSIVWVFMKFLALGAARAKEQLVTSLKSEIDYAINRAA